MRLQLQLMTSYGTNYTLKTEHQARTFVRNLPAAEQVKTAEARGKVIKKSKDTTEEKSRPRNAGMQRSNTQTINNEQREEQEESTAQTGQSKETEDETEQHTEARMEE
jgi:hypothetical protein